MKTIATYILTVGLSSTIWGQQNQLKVPPLEKQDYLNKSKSQKTTGVVLLSSGSVLATVGFAMTLSNVSGIFDPDDPPIHNSTTADILGYSGLAIAAGSIPFFIASSKNKKRAFSLSLNNQPLPQNHEKKFYYHSVPSISVSMIL